MKRFTVTICHDGDYEVHQALIDWADPQNLADHLTTAFGAEAFRFEMKIAQEHDSPPHDSPPRLKPLATSPT